MVWYLLSAFLKQFINHALFVIIRLYLTAIIHWYLRHLKWNIWEHGLKLGVVEVLCYYVAIYYRKINFIWKRILRSHGSFFQLVWSLSITEDWKLYANDKKPGQCDSVNPRSVEKHPSLTHILSEFLSKSKWLSVFTHNSWYTTKMAYLCQLKIKQSL